MWNAVNPIEIGANLSKKLRPCEEAAKQKTKFEETASVSGAERARNPGKGNHGENDCRSIKTSAKKKASGWQNTTRSHRRYFEQCIQKIAMKKTTSQGLRYTLGNGNE